MSDAELAEYVRMSALGAYTELAEMLGEIQWKPWSNRIGEVINRELYIEEAVDVLHFLGNMLIALGVTDRELAAASVRKFATNRARHASGYDAIAKREEVAPAQA